MTDTLMVGVSGVRGIVGKDLTPEVVTRWARAFGTFAREGTRDEGRGTGPSVVVGRDARTSGPAFAAAVTAGLTSVGCDVIEIGVVPTPTVQLAALDVERIRKRRFSVALDAVRGAGGPPMRDLLVRLGCRVTGINLETDGRFPRAPEPIPENLGDLAALVRRSGADVGIAVDPDVDRLAIVDETGTAIGEDYTLAFAIRAVLGGKRETGNGKRVVVCNLSTSLVVEDAAREFGADVVRTPVGEVHVARAILRLAAVIGGEGNGGVMYPALHAGRDAPVAAALLLALLARDGRRVSELVAAAPRYVILKGKAERGGRSRGRPARGRNPRLPTRAPRPPRRPRLPAPGRACPGPRAAP